MFDPNVVCHNKVLVFDVETTGLDPTKHACIEIGAVLLDETLRPIDEYSSLMAPWKGAELMKKSQEIHKIPENEFKQARPLEVVVREFHNRFGSRQPVPILAGWNVWFDVAFLRVLYEKEGIEWPFSFHFLDIQAIILFFHKMKRSSLHKTVQAMLTETQTHRAIDDARQTAKVLSLLGEQHLNNE